MIVVVYDTFCWESSNLDGIASTEVDFVEGSVPMIFRGIYPVDLLYDLAVDGTGTSVSGFFFASTPKDRTAYRTSQSTQG